MSRGRWPCCGSRAARGCRRSCSGSAATICWRRRFPKRSAAWRTITATSRFPIIRSCGRRCTTACTRRWTSIAGWTLLERRARRARSSSCRSTRASRRRSAISCLTPIRMRSSTTRRSKSGARGRSPRGGRWRSTTCAIWRSSIRRPSRRSREEAWPLVRDADELHDALMNFVVLPEEEGREWSKYFERAVAQRTGGSRHARAAGLRFWIAAERWPLVRAVYPRGDDSAGARTARRTRAGRGPPRRLGRDSSAGRFSAADRTRRRNWRRSLHLEDVASIRGARIAGRFGDRDAGHGSASQETGASGQERSRVVRTAAPRAHSSADARRPAAAD